MQSALFISPHLDDVAFSCGGTLIRMVRAGWRVLLCTAFTRSVADPQGFALECQLDKELPAEIDYMLLRRQEDEDFAKLVGLREWLHLDLPEAPHRGYAGAPELFAGVRSDDDVATELSGQLRRIAEPFDCIFGPQGLGNHADHLQTIRAIEDAGLAPRTCWYQDTPYILRNPKAQPALPMEGCVTVDIGSTLDAKIHACKAYRSQVPFQFGSPENMSQALRQFHGSSPAQEHFGFLHGANGSFYNTIDQEEKG